MQAHDTAVFTVADYQCLIILGRAQAFIGVYLPAGVVLLQHANRAQHIGVGDSVAHFIQRDAVIGEGIGVELDAYRGQGCAVDSHLTDAFNLREFLREYGCGRVVERARCKIGRAERERHNRRLRRADFAIAGIARHTRRQLTACGIECGLDIARGGIQIPVEGEFYPDKR